MLRHLPLALCLLALFGCGGEPARPAPLSRTNVYDIACPGMQCAARQNAQHTETMLELAGLFGGYRAHDMVLRVDDAVSRRTMIREKSATGADGRYAIAIDAERLPPGRYEFVLVPEDSRGMVLVAGRFTVARGGTSAPLAAATPKPTQVAAASAPAAQPSDPQLAAMLAIVGTWRGTDGVAGVLNLRSDGSYIYNDRARGHYKFYGSEIVFDGPLAAWNGGRATVKGDFLEFYWTSEDGAHQWYAFAKSS